MQINSIGVTAVAALLASSPSLAGKQSSGAILVEKVAPLAEPDATTAKFGCELRFFDISKNDGRVPCYSPQTIRAAYGLTDLIANGANGHGRTIVILDAFGSPSALADLQAFDAVFGLPDPPSFTVITMPDTPAFDPTNGNMVGWAEESSLDVQSAHAVAPSANIVLVAAASNNDDDLIAGLNYAVEHRLGDVISMSFGESEAFLGDADGQRVVKAWERGFKDARNRRITLFVSSGDQGSTNTADSAGDVFPFPNVSYPASSTRVTGVGGTNLFFGIGDTVTGHAAPVGDAGSAYIRERTWNDEPQGIAAAGGGGVSVLFPEPGYQHLGLPRSVEKTLHGRRGVPDVAYNAGVVGGVIVHLGEAITLGATGLDIPGGAFFVFGGTSAGAPQWSGIIADVNSALGKPVGFINPQLYLLGKFGVTAGLFHDIIQPGATIGNGDNGYCFFTVPNGVFQCVDGFSAAPGFDLTTGWGTPNFGRLGALLAAPDGDHDDGD
jgi:subtilase family serine protease